jgi:hypothetical protein
VFYLALLFKVPPFPGHPTPGAQCYPFACAGWVANMKDGTSVLGPDLGLSGLVHLVDVHVVVVALCALLSKPDHEHQIVSMLIIIYQ